MNTFVIALFLTLSVCFTAYATSISQPSKKDRPTKLARYEMGAYLAGEGTKLRVNIDKQLGGQVYVQLIDLTGNVYYDRTLSPTEKTARLSLDLTDLTDGDYVLRVSNGLETTIREIKIATTKPTTATRSIIVI